MQESNERRFQEEKRRQEQQKKPRKLKTNAGRRAAPGSLTQERPLYRMGKDGERIYMEDDERGRFADIWQKQADAYCR
ncbi:MAG: hypothetical protein M5R42_12470 [Rhodocyclaceae bacterium]|nr:hypothetical protein [Rhodocyclaceae bacterium]